VHAREILVQDLGVTRSTSVRYSFVKGFGAGCHEFVNVAVAGLAIRGGSISSLQGLTVHTPSVFAGHLGVALRTGGFGDAGRMGKVLVTEMAGGAVERTMG
jgi:hypothetical protein